MVNVCDDPEQAWNEVNKLIPGYFYGVVSKEFGMGGDALKRVKKDFQDEVEHLEKKMNEQVKIVDKCYND